MGQIIMGPGRCGLHFDIITGDGADLVLDFAGAGLKNLTCASLWPRLLESRVGWAAFAMSASWTAS